MRYFFSWSLLQSSFVMRVHNLTTDVMMVARPILAYRDAAVIRKAMKNLAGDQFGSGSCPKDQDPYEQRDALFLEKAVQRFRMHMRGGHMNSPVELLVIGSSPSRMERVIRCLDNQPGYLLHSVAGLAEARDKIAAPPPNLIIALLTENDTQTLQLLEPAGNFRRFPLLVLLERDDTATTVAAINAGAIDVLVESPAVYEKLPETIAANLDAWQNRRDQYLAHDYAARFGHILASALTEIYTFDAETLQIIRANRGARNNLGFSKQELRSMTPLDLKLLLSKEQFEELVRPLRSGETEAIRFESTQRRKDGSLYPIEVQLQLVTAEPAVFIAVCLDISERKQAEDQLQASEARFRSIFATAAAGIVLLSPDGDILEVNPFFCDFTGYRADELIGRNIKEVTHPEDRASTAEYYAKMRQNLDPIINIEKRYLRKDGQPRWGHVSIACLTSREPNDTYCIGLVQDMTRHKEAEAKMQAAYTELDAFVHTVAHDLRNPLTPIIGMAEFLQEHASNSLDRTALNFLADIEKSGYHMLALLEDLLTLAQVGHVPQPSSLVDTRRVVDAVLLNLAAPITEAGIDLQVGELPPLCLPETLIGQLFDNLVGNALRYAGAAGKPIQIGSEHLEKRVILFVRDHGPGIPEDEIEHIFEAFYRGRIGSQVKGTGIGLATVRKIVRLYGGDVWVEAPPRGGCTFRVEFPAVVLSCPPDGNPSTT